MPCVNEALPGCDNPPTPLLCTCMQVSDDVHIYSLSVVHTQSPQGHLEGRDQVVVYACTTAWYCKVRGVCLWPHSSSLRGHPCTCRRWCLIRQKCQRYAKAWQLQPCAHAQCGAVQVAVCGSTVAAVWTVWQFPICFWHMVHTP